MRLITLVWLLLISSPIFAQSIDVEKERFTGVNKLTVTSFNGCCSKKGYRAEYYLDKTGKAIKSSNYFKNKLLATFVYQYEYDLLALKIQIFDINNKGRIDTTSFVYEKDDSGNIIKRTESFGKWKVTELYKDFDTQGNPQKVYQEFNRDTTFSCRLYDSKNREILRKEYQNDSLQYSEEIRYDQYGNINYSNIPTLFDKETGKMISLMGGNRHSITETYEYKYDRKDHWIQKYVIVENKKVLLEKRKYE